MNEKYLTVLKRLYQTNRFKQKKVNLSNLQKATKFFSTPQDNLNFIHVTGTNGKGSVCKKLAKTFESSGYKTGLFISPHIVTFRERIQINSNLIEKEYIAEELDHIFKILDSNNIELTYFEIVTLLSLIYFKTNNIDIGVIEVGLGGNLDATNIIDPLVSVITSIGLDHTDSLGYTQKEIAEKKAGIIKRNRPVILGPDCFPKEVFIEYARKIQSEIFWVDYNNSSKISLDFDNENNAIVKKVVDVINKKYTGLFNITNDNIKIGLKTKQPCRKEDVYESIGKETIKNNIIQLIQKNYNTLKKKYSDEQLTTFKDKINDNFPLKIFLDVGHNSHGLEKLMTSIKNDFPTYKIKTVSGFSAHKDIAEIIKTLCSYSTNIYLISSKHPRVLPYQDLKSLVEDNMQNYLFYKEIIIENEWTKGKIELNLLCSIIDSVLSGKNDIIVICGSFYIMSDIRKSLGYIVEEDPLELNELNGNIKFNV